MEEWRLAAQVQARTQQRAAREWLKLFVLVSTHEQNLTGENGHFQAKIAPGCASFTQ